MTQLLSVTCHMGSHSFICYPTQVNTPHHNPSHTGRYSIYLPRWDGRLSWPRRLDSPTGRESNLRPFNHESDAQPMQPPRQMVMNDVRCGSNYWGFIREGLHRRNSQLGVRGIYLAVVLLFMSSSTNLSASHLRLLLLDDKLWRQDLGLSGASYSPHGYKDFHHTP